MEILLWFKPMNSEQQQVDLEYSRNSIYSLKTIVHFPLQARYPIIQKHTLAIIIIFIQDFIYNVSHYMLNAQILFQHQVS